MKKIHIISLVVIFLLIAISSVVVLTLYQIKNSNQNETYHIDDLDVMSQYGEYILVREHENSELETYSIYKNTEYHNYQKQFAFEAGITIEGRMLYWTLDKLYILGYSPASYSLFDGHIIDQGSLSQLVNHSTGIIDRVIGMHNDFIYYTYTYQNKSFYGKVSLDLKECVIIEKKDIPIELHF